MYTVFHWTLIISRGAKLQRKHGSSCAGEIEGVLWKSLLSFHFYIFSEETGKLCTTRLLAFIRRKTALCAYGA